MTRCWRRRWYGSKRWYPIGNTQVSWIWIFLLCILEPSSGLILFSSSLERRSTFRPLVGNAKLIVVVVVVVVLVCGTRHKADNSSHASLISLLVYHNIPLWDAHQYRERARDNDDVWRRQCHSLFLSLFPRRCVHKASIGVASQNTSNVLLTHWLWVGRGIVHTI